MGGDVELHVGGADQQVRCAEYLHHHHKGVKRLPVSELLPAQLSKPDCWGEARGGSWDERGFDMWPLNGGNG